MEQRLTTSKRVAVALTDPNPTFMSLVPKGANQTGWKVTKSEPETEMHTTNQFKFAKTNFATEGEAKGYLAAKGWVEPVITDEGDFFVAVAKAADLFEEGTIKEITCEAGVTHFAGALKDTTQKTEETTPAARPRTAVSKEEGNSEENAPAGTPETPSTKTELQPVAKEWQELTKRYDSWASYYEGQTDFNEAVQAGIDSDKGVPPGFEEIWNTARGVIRNNFAAGTTENITTVCAALAKHLIQMHGMWIVTKADNSEKAQKVAKTLFDESDNPPATSPEAGAETEQKEPANEPEQKQDETPATTESEQTKPEQKEPDASTAEPPAPADPVAEAVEKAMKAQMDAILGPIQEKLAKAEETIRELQGAPSKKGADNGDIPSTPPPPTGDAKSQTRSPKGWDDGSGLACRG